MKYRDTVDTVMSEKRLPSELAYLAFIESGYMYRATSRAQARGVWQFIRSTGMAQDAPAAIDVPAPGIAAAESSSAVAGRGGRVLRIGLHSSCETSEAGPGHRTAGMLAGDRQESFASGCPNKRHGTIREVAGPKAAHAGPGDNWRSQSDTRFQNALFRPCACLRRSR